MNHSVSYSKAILSFFRPAGATPMHRWGEDLAWRSEPKVNYSMTNFTPSVQRVALQGGKAQNRPLSNLYTGAFRFPQCCR